MKVKVAQRMLSDIEVAFCNLRITSIKLHDLRTRSMKLDDYFDLVTEDEIRLKDTRIGIETVVTEYLDGSMPEQIAVNYLTLDLEQIHATITYYLHNRDLIDAYLARLDSLSAKRSLQPGVSPVVARLRKLRAAMAES
jgi:uncharacterized protein (DUF433 family)